MKGEIWDKIKSSGSTTFETQQITKNGEVYPVEVTANYLSFNGKEYSFSFVRNITERKQAEEALFQERNLLRTLIDNLPDCVYVKDTEGRFLLANNRVTHLMGLAKNQDLLGKTDFDFLPKELAAQYRSDEEVVVRSGKPMINREESSVNASSGVRWLLSTKVPLRNALGEIVGLVGVGNDITERKQAEEELFRSRQMLQSILDNIPQPVFWKDRNSVFLGCNRAFAIDGGLNDAAEIVGKTDFDLAWSGQADLYRADD